MFAQPHRRQYFEDFLHIVAVDHFRAPTKRLETFLINLDVMAKRRRLALAQAIDIDQGHKVRQAVNAGQGGRFPHAAFGTFAVAEQDIGAEIQIDRVAHSRPCPRPH